MNYFILRIHTLKCNYSYYIINSLMKANSQSELVRLKVQISSLLKLNRSTAWFSEAQKIN